MKCCNHFIGCAWIWLLWHEGDCGMRVVGKMAKDVGTAIRKSIMVSFLPCLVTDSIPTCFFIF